MTPANHTRDHHHPWSRPVDSVVSGSGDVVSAGLGAASTGSGFAWEVFFLPPRRPFFLPILLLAVKAACPQEAVAIVAKPWGRFKGVWSGSILRRRLRHSQQPVSLIGIG